jgi:hypothetical protein
LPLTHPLESNCGVGWQFGLQAVVEIAVKWSGQLPEANPMRCLLCVSLLILSMPTAYAAPLPGDSANGKRLFEANCMGCHDTSVLTRNDRVVQSLGALKEQLAGCAHMAKKEFSESEAQDLLKYLNDQFYHFR